MQQSHCILPTANYPKKPKEMFCQKPWCSLNTRGGGPDKKRRE